MIFKGTETVGDLTCMAYLCTKFCGERKKAATAGRSLANFSIVDPAKYPLVFFFFLSVTYYSFCNDNAALDESARRPGRRGEERGSRTGLELVHQNE